MHGLFAEWQGRYADHGIATFPVHPDKRPAIKGYLKVGSKVSEQLALKFPDAQALGFACRRNRITVLDVDTNDERVLADGFARYGRSPFVVRSGSGNYQAWYRHNGEGRKVRPDPQVPVDILGDGFVVAPPSIGSKGQPYRIVEGSLDDLASLPKMAVPQQVEPSASSPPMSAMRQGDGRNHALFVRACRSARQAQTREELLQMTLHANDQFAEPLPISEVQRVAHSAWRYKEENRLMVGGGEANAVVFNSDAAHLWDQPLAMLLLVRLRLAHGWRNGGEFALAKATSQTLGVSIPTYLAARDVLVDRFFIAITHPGGRGKNDPPRARLL